MKLYISIYLTHNLSRISLRNVMLLIKEKACGNVSFSVLKNTISYISCCCSIAKSCLTLCYPMGSSIPGFPVLHYFLEYCSLKLTLTVSVMPFYHIILCCPLLLLPSILPSVRGFSNELAVSIRWLKYWSFSFSISPSNEYSGLISFRID